MPKKLVIELSDADESRLHAEAARLGVSDEDLARAIVTGQLSQSDDAFRKAMDFVLSKNADLYKRLA